MTIIVEDGSIVANANSYVTLDELVAYAYDRGAVFTGDATILMYKAMDYLESQNLIGNRYTRDQSLQWPRDGVYIDNYYYAPSEIPQLLKNAQMATAIAIGDDADPLSIITPEVKSEKIGKIEVTYKDSSVSASIARTVSAALYKLTTGGSGINARVYRG